MINFCNNKRLTEKKVKRLLATISTGIYPVMMGAYELDREKDVYRFSVVVACDGEEVKDFLNQKIYTEDKVLNPRYINIDYPHCYEDMIYSVRICQGNCKMFSDKYYGFLKGMIKPSMLMTLDIDVRSYRKPLDLNNLFK